MNAQCLVANIEYAIMVSRLNRVRGELHVYP